MQQQLLGSTGGSNGGSSSSSWPGLQLAGVKVKMLLVVEGVSPSLAKVVHCALVLSCGPVLCGACCCARARGFGMPLLWQAGHLGAMGFRV
jgi:hypothetical protein